MATRARHGSYLFQRPESRMWWLRLRSPGKVHVHSLKTADKTQAEMLAAPLIAEHKSALLAARPRLESAWRHDLAPGLHDVDGGKVFATDRELHYLDADGRTVKTTPNGKMDWRIAGDDRLGIGGGFIGRLIEVDAEHARPVLPIKDDDDALLETYIAHKTLKPGRAKEARDVFRVFKTTVGKPLSKCDRNDGREVVAALGDVKSATLRRKMVPLVAMVNFAISEGKLSFNPFVSVVAERDDSERRLPFDDSDMKLIRANLPKLSVQDQLLVRTLATTGMRLSEAFEIDREQTEGGCRFVVVGTKTDQSLRRVPLPAALLKHLPKAIKGKLFGGRPNSASTRLGKWLRDECKITDSTKVAAHSYRHRAKDQLRKAGVHPDVQEEIFGRDKKTIAAGYGIGSPVPLLRKVIDRIGF